MQFQKNELPALRKRLQTVDREAERLKGDVEEQEALLAVLRSEEEKAKDCLQGISLMDSYLVPNICLSHSFSPHVPDTARTCTHLCCFHDKESSLEST